MGAPVNFGWLGGAPNFFPVAAAPHVSGWRRRRNSAAEGSSLHQHNVYSALRKGTGFVPWESFLFSGSKPINSGEPQRRWCIVEDWMYLHWQGHRNCYKVGGSDRQADLHCYHYRNEVKVQAWCMTNTSRPRRMWPHLPHTTKSATDSVYHM